VRTDECRSTEDRAKQNTGSELGLESLKLKVLKKNPRGFLIKEGSRQRCT